MLFNTSFGQVVECDYNISYSIVIEDVICGFDNGSISLLLEDEDNNYIFEWTLPNGDVLIGNSSGLENTVFLLA
ncbi:hypothetical protein AB832_05060 [Flavobacteriaceae bacterium (ex Bugula neritina AB1)]|nr:hypothetical protein AB832_05060 [Flavobacteriaceae bacterium (ex Bugula neritina AB1)]